MNEAYSPISCINHERLEFAVLRKQWLEIEVIQGDHHAKIRMLPLDVYAREGVEWLEAQRESGEKLTLRLDQISF